MNALLLIPPIIGGYFLACAMKKTLQMKWVVGLLLALVILGLVAAVLPRFVTSRTTSHPSRCLSNLRQTDVATQQWALEHKKQDSDAPDLSGILFYLKDKALPICQGGGSYTLGTNVMDNPTCSLGADSVMGDAHRLHK